MSISATNNWSTITSSNLNAFSLLNSQKNSTSATDDKDISSKAGEMRDLVDKVASGTGSDSDISELLAKLKEMATDVQSRFNNTASADSTSSDSEMKSLIDKVINGTATADDVKTIAEKMKDRASDMQAHFGGGKPPMPPSGSSDDELKNLIDSVAAGTASDSDIETLTAKLKEMATEMQSQSSDTTSTSTSTTASTSDMDSLMKKVLDGTATDDDIKTIATKMKEHESEMQANATNVVAMSGGLLGQQLLDSMMQSYEKNESNYTLPSGASFSV